MYNKILVVFILLIMTSPLQADAQPSLFSFLDIPGGKYSLRQSLDFCAVNSSVYKTTNFDEISVLLFIAEDLPDNRCAKYFIGLQHHKGYSTFGIGNGGYIGNRDRLDKAFKFYKESAKLNFSHAQYALATMYEYGTRDHVRSKRPFARQDINKAIKWYSQAALQGHINATLRLKNLIYEFTDILGLDPTEVDTMPFEAHDLANKATAVQDYDTAFLEWSLLAQKGDSEAQYQLGLMLSNDEFKIQREKTSSSGHILMPALKSNSGIEWYRESAINGHPKAQYKLALFLLKRHKLLQQNYDKNDELFVSNSHLIRTESFESPYKWYAIKLLISSAKQGNESAKHELEEIASSIDLKPHKDKLAGIDRFMYDLRSTLVLGVIDRYWGEGVDAVEYSIKYFRHHRLLGFAIENYNKKNYEDAFLQLLKLSSDSDNVEAQGYLGLTYLFFKKDYVEAILLLKRAVNKGFDFAKPGLAEAYYKLGLSEESNQEAIELFKKSAEMGLDKAYYQLGNTYLSQGKYEDAIESFEIALRRGDVNAKAKLAKTYYLLGEYYLTSNSYEKAIKWYFLSENTGYKLSKKLLGRLKGIQRYGGEFSGSGSGFVVSKNGIIATNNHIVKGCKSIWVEGMKAVEIDRNNQVDLALIKVDKKFNNVSSISTRSIELGEDVTVFGFPFSSDLGSEYPTLTRGEVSSIPEVPEFKGSFRFSAPVNKGNSGGPIVNNNGLVIGVTLATFSKKEAQNVNIGIKAFNLISMLKNNNIKISNDSIKSIIEHYSDVTKYIECYE